ncbi:unnamed protein product [Rotaria socialis]|uniref:Uncharacterized protein n=1 Tax=Rotaria socialis TaxID=392032 RepID=A0A818QLP7_9BILA|nr:unnamed protein product [Rotaria socialis]CAF4475985.1 unnamed protein product [Rotaria socialis]
MASVSDEIPSMKKNEVKSSPAANKASVESGKLKSVKTKSSTKKTEEKKEQVEEKQKQPSTSAPTESNNSLSTKSDVEEGSTFNPSKEIKEENHDSKIQEPKSHDNKPQEQENHDVKPQEQENHDVKPQEQENHDVKPQEQENHDIKPQEQENHDSKPQEQEKPVQKARSVNFASTAAVDTDAPKLRPSNSFNTRSSYSPSKPSRQAIDFIDTLVESYRLETSNSTLPIQETKYVPKTSRSRINPNWREHRTRRLMNRLEELSLWDREEELKASQAQALREQKWEQILDRQRNHDLCLSLMRQRHESEMESAIKLDPGVTGINDENTSATIANAVNLSIALNGFTNDVPPTPQSLKRRVRQDEEKTVEFKTPIGRYRQFEKNMTNKLDKINQKLKPDREIMNAYNPNSISLSSASVPLFSETYSALLSVPDTYSSNKYNQYHYGVASYLHQPYHASSPDFETRLRSYSNRDVRVPLKEQANDYRDYDDDKADEYNRSNLIDNSHYTKYRSNPIDNESHKKYRSNSTDDGYYSKHRSNRIDEDYDSKYLSSPIDEEYTLKYRSNPIDEDYSPKHRSKLVDDEYEPKHRSKLVDDEYEPKYRSKLADDDYNLKCRTKLADDDYNPKYRSKHVDEEYNHKYRSTPIDDDDEDYYPKYRTKPIDDNYYTKYRSTLASKLDYSPPRRTTSLVSATASALYDPSTIPTTPREYSLIHSRPPASKSIHLRSLNDDLNAITRFSTETSKKILQTIGDSTNDSSIKSLSSTIAPKKYASIRTQDSDDENIDYNSSRNYSSKTTHKPTEIISLSSTR